MEWHGLSWYGVVRGMVGGVDGRGAGSCVSGKVARERGEDGGRAYPGHHT